MDINRNVLTLDEFTIQSLRLFPNAIVELIILPCEKALRPNASTNRFFAGSKAMMEEMRLQKRKYYVAGRLFQKPNKSCQMCFLFKPIRFLEKPVKC